MQVEWSKRSVSCYESVFTTDFTEEAVAESVVPDVLPDMEEIISAQGMVYIRSKEHQNGHLLLTANVAVTVLYLAAGELCPHKLTLDIPYQKDIYAPEITEQDVSLATISVCAISARPLNPRKIQVQALLQIHAESFLPGEIALAEGLQDADGTCIYKKTEEIEVDAVTGVLEKSFVLTDEYPLSGTRAPAKELICQHAELLPEEVKFVGTKMIFKGIVKTQLLWLCEDDSLYASSFTSGFSQIMEAENVSEDAEVNISLTLTGAYFEMLFSSNDSRIVSAQLNILVQAKCVQRQKLCYIADVYSNSCALQPGYGAERRFRKSERAICKDNMRGVIELPISVQEVVQTTAGLGKWAETETGFSCPVNVSVLFRDREGVLHGIDRCFTAQWEQGERQPGTQAWLESPCCMEIYATPALDGIEVRLMVQAETVTAFQITIYPLESLSVMDGEAFNTDALPSVTVLPKKSGDTWQLAKTYHSTVELIEAANRDLDCSVLLIPKAK